MAQRHVDKGRDEHPKTHNGQTGRIVVPVAHLQRLTRTALPKHILQNADTKARQPSPLVQRTGTVFCYVSTPPSMPFKHAPSRASYCAGGLAVPVRGGWIPCGPQGHCRLLAHVFHYLAIHNTCRQRVCTTFGDGSQCRGGGPMRFGMQRFRGADALTEGDSATLCQQISHLCLQT